MINEEKTLKVPIPAGVMDRQKLTFPGYGNAAPRNGENGDLLVVISVEKHPLLIREGNNLYYDHYISFADAALGTHAEIPTVDKKVKIKLKEGLQSGKILRLKGKGLPSYNQYGTGDLIIHVNVWTPQDLSSEQKKFFEKSQKSDNFTPDNNRNEMSFFEKIKQMFDL